MNKRRSLRLLSVLCLLSFQQARAQEGEPVFKVHFPAPTADKPQCKLWYWDAAWWALMPGRNGASLWKRDSAGWKPHLPAGTLPPGVKGRADVWTEGNKAWAVTVEDTMLYVLEMDYHKDSSLWTAGLPTPLRPLTPGAPIESATIARDRAGHLWVAADAGKEILVWHRAGNGWQPALSLKKGISDDDICSLAVLPRSILVIWSDQEADEVACREHLDGEPVSRWGKRMLVEKGGHTADDHLHTTVLPDGSVWLATKNSLDESGKPQLVMRVRSNNGTWKNLPYLLREPGREPSRPVVIGAGNGTVLAGHSIYDKNDRTLGCIEFGLVDTTSSEVLTSLKKVIRPASSYKTRINDVTVPREGFPANGPWIVLASDEEGRIYEADLKTFFML